MSSPEPAQPPHVLLLADDYPDSLDMYREALELKGYQVITANDGVEAVDRARECRPAIVLLDIRMPRMTGVEAMQALKQDPLFTNVPIVALTAHALQREREKFLAAGFDAVLTKPCLPDDLLATIETWLKAKPLT
jgi:CheY-like chemotaxis protein